MPNTEEKRKRGRVPVGVGPNGEPELTSKYPKLAISIRPAMKMRLDAASTLTRLPAWRIVDQALVKYLESISPEDRKAIESMARRIEERPAS